MPQPSQLTNQRSEPTISQTDQHVYVGFPETYCVLSSAFYNGGFTEAKHLLNLKVAKHYKGNQTPQESLKTYCSEQQWQGTTVGMMTAASMKSLRIHRATEQDTTLTVLATAGLANARRIGDPADYPTSDIQTPSAGTINIMVISSCAFSPAAMVEAIQMVTEAKTAAIYDLNIESPKSNRVATGTGTDATAIACAPTQNRIEYCGKHVVVGELLGRLSYNAVLEAATEGLA